MKKRLFTIICAVFVCVMLCTAVSADNIASGTCGAGSNNISWVLDDTGTLTIEGDGEMCDFSDIEPAQWNVYASDIVSAVIGEGVTGIGDYSFFGCSELVSVSVPKGVTRIGDCAFRDCGSLTSILIPRTVTEIGDFAFDYCTSLEEVVVQSWNTEFGESVFDTANPGLIIHGYEGSTAEAYAFANSRPFEKILGYSGICGARGDNLTWFIDDEGTLIIEGEGEMRNFSDSEPAPWQEYNSASDIVSVVIGDGVTSIGDYAFLGCSELVSVAVPRGVSRIGDCAFRDCVSLTSILIPRTVTEIGDFAFDWCTSLEEVVVQSWDAAFGEQVFDTAGSGLIIRGYEDSTAEAYAALSSRTFIKLNGYHGECGDTLTWVLYDDGELVIEGDGEMDNWKGSLISRAPWYTHRNKILKVTVQSGVTGIGNYAFYKCAAVTDVTIPESVLSIGTNAFNGCTALKSVNIPSGVAEIGDYLFNKCGSLVSIVLPEGLTRIGNYAFSECSALESLNIPDGVTEIGDYAFSCCEVLGNVELPQSVVAIGTWAFSDCYAFTEITLAEGLEDIGDYAFGYCENLSKVTVYSRDAVFGADAFSNIPKEQLVIHGYKGSTAEEYANSRAYSFIALVEPIIYGDATGDGVTGTDDLEFLAKYIACWKGFNADTVNLDALDLNADGMVDSVDLIIFARHLAGWAGYEALPFSAVARA